MCFLGKSFRHEQCEAKNGYQSDAKGVKTFVEWVPKYAGVLPGDVCKLTCRAKGTGYYVVFSPKVSAHSLSGNSRHPLWQVFGKMKPADTKCKQVIIWRWLDLEGFYFYLYHFYIFKLYTMRKNDFVNRVSKCFKS